MRTPGRPRGILLGDPAVRTDRASGPARFDAAVTVPASQAPAPGEASAPQPRGLHFRFILTVENPAAQRFQRFDGFHCERLLRDAVEKTFRGAARAPRASSRSFSTEAKAVPLTLTSTRCSAPGSRTGWPSTSPP